MTVRFSPSLRKRDQLKVHAARFFQITIIRDASHVSPPRGRLAAPSEDLKALTDAIKTANDPSRSLDELQEAVGLPSNDGYHDHHIAEQKAARDAGYPESLIQSRDNLVRIPIIKHIDITSYYATKIEQEDGSMLSPRESLKGKDFETRRQFGLDMLRRYGVLK